MKKTKAGVDESVIRLRFGPKGAVSSRFGGLVKYETSKDAWRGGKSPASISMNGAAHGG